MFRLPIPDGQTLWSELIGYANAPDKQVDVDYVNAVPPSSSPVPRGTLGTRLTMLSDYGFSKFVVSATAAAICPEPYLEISLKPDEQKVWTTQYLFETIAK